MRGDHAKADEYFKLAREYAARLAKEANDGDHLRLAFDRPGSWSQKYNMVWDRILGVEFVSGGSCANGVGVLQKDAEQIRSAARQPRNLRTKLDWITWTATLTRKIAKILKP